MEHRFLAAIDAAVDRALPAGWPRLPRHWLPVRGSVQARHAFRLAHDTGPRPYLVVIAVPPFAARTAAVEGDLVALVDHVLGRGGTVLLLYEHESDPNGWVREHLDFPHPRFLCLPCFAPAADDDDGADAGGTLADGAHGGLPGHDGSHSSHGAEDDGDPSEDYIAEPTGVGPEPLSAVIRDLWSGHLFYDGPWEGVQTVGVEIMENSCWRCGCSLDVVTGIVFPDREVADWSRCDWTYYQSLLQLARIPDSVIPTLSAAVEAWRAAGHRQLSVIRWRYSKSLGYAYWAAECTACRAFQGDFPMEEERMPLLDDLDSRRTGILSYRPLRLDVPRQALQELTWSMEMNPHARLLGWYRAGVADLERSTETGDRIDSRVSLSGETAPDAAAAAGSNGSATLRSPDLRAATAIRYAAETTGEVIAEADSGLPSAATFGFNAISAAAASCAAIPKRGPVRRLGEILVAWLGWIAS
jgi:hypothetical protein